MTGSPVDRLFLDFQTALAGRYSLERELGRGGMGVVYLAREVRLDRPVAIKLLPPGKAGDAALRERFLREARTAAKLSHPNIVPIHAVDEVGEFVFFAMAYVEGETLTERVRQRGPLSPSDATRVLREVAWALAYAHSHGIIHRDVKPDNILLEGVTGRALVADFGIAGLVTGAAALDGGQVIGTPEFMSPEQALGEQVDGRSDLYSLGIVGFFALTGRLPFDAAKATEVLAKQVTEPAPLVGSVAAGVPRKLAQAVDRCLLKQPDERFQKSEDLADRLALAVEQRREIPVVLRVFVKRHGEIGLGTGLVYFYAVSLVSAILGMTVGAGASWVAGWGTFLGGVIVGPLAYLFHRARMVLKAGYGQEDVAVAFKTVLDEAREERAFEYGRGPSAYEKSLRWTTAIGLGAGAVSFILAVNTTPWFLALASYSFVIGAGAGTLALLRLSRRRDTGQEFWSWFWKSRFGRWVFRNAARRVPAIAHATSVTHRPTEFALGMAAEKLFDELPKETRRQLRDLPDVVHKLEADAQRMRKRLDELNDALGDVRESGGGTAVVARRDRIVTDLQTERDRVQQRLADVVAALETIRLNLLRLHAGAGSVRNLTTDLGLAREVAAEVDLLLQGHREIEESL